jgi:hypothetical protein
VEDEDEMEIDSGDESDGKSALREVEAREEPKASRRGPGNESLKCFHDPTPVIDRSKQKRWEFQCRSCRSYVQLNDLSREKKTYL